MPKFTYVGDEGRTYPFHPEGAREPVAGESYDLDDDPGDGRWQPVSTGKAAKTTASTDTSAPATADASSAPAEGNN